MDIFTEQTARTIGHGGLRCPCCANGFRNKKGKKKGLSSLRRARLRQETIKEVVNNN